MHHNWLSVCVDFECYGTDKKALIFWTENQYKDTQTIKISSSTGLKKIMNDISWDRRGVVVKRILCVQNLIKYRCKVLELCLNSTEIQKILVYNVYGIAPTLSFTVVAGFEKAYPKFFTFFMPLPY